VSAQVSTAGTPQGKRTCRECWPEQTAAPRRLTLQTSLKVEANGEAISTAKFVPNGWHHATVPHHRGAALVKDKTLPIFLQHEFAAVPGVTYPIAEFSSIPDDTRQPLCSLMVYRNAFLVPAAYRGKTVWLNFKGINYRANIWLNGKQIGLFSDVAGAWRTYEFNVTDAVKLGAGNVLAVQAFAPTQLISPFTSLTGTRAAGQKYGPMG